MKKVITTLLISMICLVSQAIVVETGSLKAFLYGTDENLEYDNYSSHIAEGIASANYNYYAPFDPQTNGFGDFQMPNSTDLTNWTAISEAFVAGNYEQAQTLLDNNSYPYHVVQFNDTDFDRTYYMLRETLNDDFDDNIDSDPTDDVTGSFDYGWGLYIFNPEASNPIVVTAPHPTDDFPTIVTSYHCFVEWDSMFLLVTGAGREVKWTNQAPYYNSKSLSDPTRNINHPYNKSYQAFCDHIRDTFGRLEFSAQMHSYDWGDRHTGYPPCQISAGGTRPCPNLPIRDLSGMGHDMFNSTPDVVFPANTFGVHREVTRDEYMAVHNEVYDFNINNNPDTPANDYIDLWGYSQNRQMQYTLSGTNDYDVVDPFFHIEIDELPEVYDQTEENYYWFWGYNPLTQRFEQDKIFTMTENFYLEWIHRITENLDYLLNLEDETVPSVSNFASLAQNYNAISLQWEPVNDFNFESYEILYATEEIADDNYQVWDRSNDNMLASMRTGETLITSLNPDTNYHFKIRVTDYAGNTSMLSDEVVVETSPYRISNFKAYSDDGAITIQWNAQNESSLSIYKIHRRQVGGTWEGVENVVATNESNNHSYQWIDTDVTYGTYYEYKLEVFTQVGESYQYDYTVSAHASDYIQLIVSNQDVTVADTVVISCNAEASDSYDSYYDVVTSTSGSGDYIVAALYEQYWDSSQRYLEKEVDADINLNEDYATFVLAVRSSLTNEQLNITVCDFDERSTRKVVVRESSSNIADLNNDELNFQVSNTSFKAFNVYYGNLNPTLVMSSAPAYKIYHPNESINFQWSTQNQFLVDHYKIELMGDDSTILVDDNAAANTSYYPWFIPTDTNIQDAKLVVTIYALDGEEITYISDWELGVLPLELNYYFDQGYQMVSHVWQDETVSANDLFGAGNMLYEFTLGQTFNPTLFYNFGKGYWVNCPADVESTIDLPVTNDEFTVALNAGWNLLGNPYPSFMDVSGFIFKVDGVEYSMGEMLTNGFISRGIYDLDYNGYHLTDRIKPMEAFFLHNNLDLNIVELTYTPYYDHYELELIPSEWDINIVANNGQVDNLTLGFSNYASDEYDMNIDLPKAPGYPFDGVDLYIAYPEDDLNFMYDKGHVDYKSPMFAEEMTSKSWMIGLNCETLDSVELQYNAINFPTNELFTYIRYNGELYYFDQEHNFQFEPTEIGEYMLELVVSQVMLSNDNGSVDPFTTQFDVYPNPFNPETSISFNIKNDSKVELDVFNIKGQKVKSICSGQMTAGTHTYVWNGRNSQNKATASGVYFMRLKVSGEKTRVKKVMLMK